MKKNCLLRKEKKKMTQDTTFGHKETKKLHELKKNYLFVEPTYWPF